MLKPITLLALVGASMVATSVPAAAQGTIPLRATAVDAGDFHACAILETGAVRCWGNNGSGQLGYGNTTTIGDDESPDAAGPVDLGPGRTATAIAAGGRHTCAVLDDGAVRCWGDNASGQLGIGTTDALGDDEPPRAVGAVQLGRRATAITAGDSHTCALLDDGSVRCWGNAFLGQLGSGSQDDIGDNETPDSVAPVKLGVGRTATSISAGDSFTCALLDDGSVRCWGDNFDGQLGRGDNRRVGDDETPDAVPPVSLGAGRTAIAISASERNACAVLDTGAVRCWGNNTYGQLGHGNTDTIGDDETPDTAGPVQLGGRAIAVDTGDLHACAILEGGAVRCWGNSLAGRLGYGTGDFDDVGDDETPDTRGPVKLGPGRTALALRAGYQFTCAILDDGSVRCWGGNLSGQLGYATTTNVGDDETPDAAGPVKLGTRTVSPPPRVDPPQPPAPPTPLPAVDPPQPPAPPAPPATGGGHALRVTLSAHRLKAPTGRRTAVHYRVSEPAAVELRVRRGRRTLAVVRARAHDGRNRLFVRAPRRTGSYQLVIHARVGARVATDRGRLTVRRR
jgi:alpha-tubulin suppressor-like RCC1 family protein